ncbi:MAG: GatB/YqeY domain-containing protein, partial [Runella slithyformis]
QEQNRPDLLEKELVEIAVIEEYLPKQLTEEEVKVVLQEIMTRVGAKTPADIGKVMGVAMKELAGKTDGKVVQTLVKTLLS